MVRAGDAFLFPVDESGLRHFYIVISDPLRNPQSIVLVNLTAFDTTCDCNYKDDACVLEPDDWEGIPFLRRTSSIDYARAKGISLAALSLLVSAGTVEVRGNVGTDLLKRILEKTAETTQLPWKYRKILEDQALIEE